MDQPLTWLDWVYVAGGAALLFGALFFWAIWNYLPIKPPPRKRDWEPALEPEPEVHVLGSSYPTRHDTFLNHLVAKTYTVPKDPEEYAKIFVPTKDRKDATNDCS